MRGLTILDFSKGALSQILAADSATWNAQVSAWDFFDGTIYLVASDGSYRNIVKFEQHQLKIPRAPLDLASRGRDYDEMNIIQAEAYLQLLEQGGDEKKIRKLRVRIQQKYAFPFICVVFGLVGSALGTLPNQRANRATGFGISILIIFSYYLLSFIWSSLGIRGVVSPFSAAWFPVFLGTGVGGLLLFRAAR